MPAVLLNPRAQIESSRLSCDGVTVRYEADGRTIWEILITDLICIGEYTHANGPWDDDYFMVFGLRSGLWYEASFYDNGRDQAIEALRKALGCELRFGLIQSTTLASRVMWPKDLEGQPLVLSKRMNPEVKRRAESRQL